MPLSVRPWTDEELIEQIDRGRFEEVKARCAHELAKRFRDGFVVYDTCRRAYVESIDTYDGETEWTTTKAMARIFSGETWIQVWAKSGRVFERPETGE